MNRIITQNLESARVLNLPLEQLDRFESRTNLLSDVRDHVERPPLKKEVQIFERSLLLLGELSHDRNKGLAEATIGIIIITASETSPSICKRESKSEADNFCVSIVETILLSRSG